MKVIAMIDSKKYICEVSHEELEKVTDKYYGKLEPLKVGSEMDLGMGYNFKVAIADSCRQMSNAMESFQHSKDMLLMFAKIVGNINNNEGNLK